jgi:hypothetical protein
MRRRCVGADHGGDNRAEFQIGKHHIVIVRSGTVTLRCREREASATQELSGLCDRVPPRGHRRSAKRTVGLG